MLKYLDYEGIPAVFIHTEFSVRAEKLVRANWEPLFLGDVGRKGYVMDEADWREMFRTELIDAPPIPES